MDLFERPDLIPDNINNTFYYIIDDSGTEITHDMVRITDSYTLEKILKESPHISESMVKDIHELMFRHRNTSWEFKGDGDTLGFIFDVWDGNWEDVVETYQLWFDDYM